MNIWFVPAVDIPILPAKAFRLSPLTGRQTVLMFMGALPCFYRRETTFATSSLLPALTKKLKGVYSFAQFTTREAIFSFKCSLPVKKEANNNNGGVAFPESIPIYLNAFLLKCFASLSTS